MRFSERIGKRPIKVEVQIDSMDVELQNSLWNLFSLHINSKLRKQTWVRDSSYSDFITSLWFSFFKEPIDDIPSSTEDLVSMFRYRFFTSWNYLDIYDFFDYLLSANNTPFDKHNFILECNYVLKKELSAYRIIEGQLRNITNELEIAEIENAISESRKNKLEGVSLHLSDALNKLTDRKNPDYRNSIKESISAVESICRQITGDSSGSLRKAMDKLKEKLPIHGALEKGFQNLYGWTSDENGVRHSMMEEPNLDQEDALFMLVSCSTFVNYLISKAQKAGVTFS